MGLVKSEKWEVLSTLLLLQPAEQKLGGQAGEESRHDAGEHQKRQIHGHGQASEDGDCHQGLADVVADRTVLEASEVKTKRCFWFSALTILRNLLR